jgi:hypothetical protein
MKKQEVYVDTVDKYQLDKELSKIENAGIREFTRNMLMFFVPDNFWTDPSSYSGLYHSGDSRVEHVKSAFAICNELVRLYNLNPLHADCARAAILLHDCMCYKDETGHTNVDHAEMMATAILDQWNSDAKLSVTKPILGEISDAVRDHMSWWGMGQFVWTDIHIKTTTKVVILSDYLSSRRSFSINRNE